MSSSKQPPPTTSSETTSTSNNTIDDDDNPLNPITERTSSVFSSSSSVTSEINVDDDDIIVDDHQKKKSPTTTTTTEEPLIKPTSFKSSKNSTNQIESEWTRRDKEQDLELDRQLQQAIKDAGVWAYGIIAVELWAIQDSDDDDLLYTPTGGLWMDPLAHRGQCEHGCNACRLTDPTMPNYIPPDPVAVGEGLPGILWEESSAGDQYHKLNWRHIPELVDDPHRQYNQRMAWWITCGITWACGIPFKGYNGSSQGIVVFLARSGIAQPLLRSSENEDYLRAVSNQIGSLYSVSSSRKQMIAKRRHERNIVLRRIKIKLLAVVRFGGNLKTLTDNNHAQSEKSKEFSLKDSHNHDDGNNNDDGESFDAWRSWKGNWKNSFNSHRKSIINFANPCVNFKDWLRWLYKKSIKTVKKTTGKGVPPPPLPAWQTAILAGIGSFVTLLAVTRFNVVVVTNLGTDYRIILGPMGAFVTLLYGLTSAPAAQPLNAMAGQTLSMIIAILISYITNMDIYMKQSLATSLSIFVMVKLGLTHPPAGASALVFSSSSNGSIGFMNMVVTLLAVFICIVFSSLINNTQSKRQYPTFWGIWYIIEKIGIDQWSIKI